jgi:hypothetical protein
VTAARVTRWTGIRLPRFVPFWHPISNRGSGLAEFPMKLFRCAHISAPHRSTCVIKRIYPTNHSIRQGLPSSLVFARALLTVDATLRLRWPARPHPARTPRFDIFEANLEVRRPPKCGIQASTAEISFGRLSDSGTKADRSRGWPRGSTTAITSASSDRAQLKRRIWRAAISG